MSFEFIKRSIAMKFLKLCRTNNFWEFRVTLPSKIKVALLCEIFKEKNILILLRY
jgi:hypothetical protein